MKTMNLILKTILHTDFYLINAIVMLIIWFNPILISSEQWLSSSFTLMLMQFITLHANLIILSAIKFINSQQVRQLAIIIFISLYSLFALAVSADSGDYLLFFTFLLFIFSRYRIFANNTINKSIKIVIINSIAGLSLFLLVPLCLFFISGHNFKGDNIPRFGLTDNIVRDVLLTNQTHDFVAGSPEENDFISEKLGYFYWALFYLIFMAMVDGAVFIFYETRKNTANQTVTIHESTDQKFNVFPRSINESDKPVFSNKLMGYVFIIISLPALIGGFFWFSDSVKKVISFQKTIGTVIDFNTTGSNFPIIEFTVNDKKIKFISNIRLGVSAKNQKVDVLYDPNHPQTAHIFSFNALWIGPILIFGLSVPLLAISWMSITGKPIWLKKNN